MVIKLTNTFIMREQDVLNLNQASFEFGAADEGFTHFHERSYHKDTHVNGLRAVENVGSHDGAMLGEGMGQFSPPAMAGAGRKLRPDSHRI